MSVIEKRLGSRITEIRLSRKITQAELAERTNVSVETISRMERGVSFPSLKTLENIAHVLNTPLKDFFDFDRHESKDQVYERELSKMITFLRTLDIKDLSLLRRILKNVYTEIKRKH